jgi:exosortase A
VIWGAWFVKPESGALLRPENSSSETFFAGWALPAAMTLAALVWLLGWYGETAGWAVRTWRVSDTYAHGFLIIPISVYLIWARRREVRAIVPKPDFIAFGLLAALGFVWLLAKLADVVVVQQYALVAMICAVVWGLLGRRVFGALFFPLMFLFFAVPVGDFLLAPLINFTADFTVTALTWTGIPVYREGTFFSVPSGNWSVVEACSGLRYLIASFTLGCLYAYLTYRSPVRRLIFALVSICLPILANGLRAYMIVMIGHLSNMKLAVGVDHLIYGWVFFGLVMLLLFWIGSFWREDQVDETAPQAPVVPAIVRPNLPAFALAGVLSGLVVAVWPAFANTRGSDTAIAQVVALQLPTERNGWKPINEKVSDWFPRFFGARRELMQTYEKNGVRVSLLMKYYRNQGRGAELISSDNRLVPLEDHTWGNVSEAAVKVPIASGSVSVREIRLHSPHQRLLLWHWYWVDGEPVISGYVAKVMQAKSLLLRNRDDAAAMFLFTPLNDSISDRRSALEDFAGTHFDQIQASLTDAGK